MLNPANEAFPAVAETVLANPGVSISITKVTKNSKKHTDNNLSDEVTAHDSTFYKSANNISSMPNTEYELNFQHRGIHIGNLNIRHLKPKLDEVKILLNSSNKVDIFGLCETFLKTNIDDKTISIDGYTIERKDRDAISSIQTNNGGGILIYLANHIDYVRRHDLETDDIESVWVEIRVKNSKSFLLCSVYRQPSAKNDWFDKFSVQLERSEYKNNELYIMGDLNIDIKDGRITNTTWKHITELNNLHQVIREPTRITAHSKTLIDHIYASNPENVTDPFVFHTAMSDHYPICFTRVT